MRQVLAILILLFGIEGMSYRAFSSIDTLALQARYDMDGKASISMPSHTQDSLVDRSTKSYLIADYADNDTAFLKAKCRQAGLDLGLIVVANRIPTSSKLVSP